MWCITWNTVHFILFQTKLQDENENNRHSFERQKRKLFCFFFGCFAIEILRSHITIVTSHFQTTKYDFSLFFSPCSIIIIFFMFFSLVSFEKNCSSQDLVRTIHRYIKWLRTKQIECDENSGNVAFELDVLHIFRVQIFKCKIMNREKWKRWPFCAMSPGDFLLLLLSLF